MISCRELGRQRASQPESSTSSWCFKRGCQIFRARVVQRGSQDSSGKCKDKPRVDQKNVGQPIVDPSDW
jgi:hypothetical protein